jgi:hypothetical protein
MVLENMKRNLKIEKQCRDYAHDPLVFFAFAQIKGVATSRSSGALLSICCVVMDESRASSAAPTFSRPR